MQKIYYDVLQSATVVNQRKLVSGKWKVFCSALALLYAGDVMAMQNYMPNGDRERSVEKKVINKSLAISRARSSSRDRDVDARKNAVKETSWEEYMSDQPKGNVVIKDKFLSFDDSNFGDLLHINETYSFPELKKLEISQPSGELWTSDHNKVLSVLLSKSPNLEKLNLSSTGLTKLPKEIGKLTNLMELNISFCKNLKKLPKEIGNLKNLTELNLLYCKNLKKLPKEIGNLKNLTELNISCKNLTKLPKEIDKLTNLTELNLSYCKNLTELSKEIGSLVNLERLGLLGIEAFDSIDDISDEILSLPKLGWIILDDEDGEYTSYNKENISKEEDKRNQERIREEKRKSARNIRRFDTKKLIEKWISRFILPKLARNTRRFDIKRPIEEWIASGFIVPKFDSDEEENFYKNETWNPKLSLEENQKALLDHFVNKCCDFSFALDGYEKTRFSYVESITEDDELKYKEQIIKYLEKITKNPVGCEFLRVMLAKTVYDNLKKMKFFIAEDTHNLGRAWAVSGRHGRYMFLTPEFLKEYHSHFMKRDIKSGKLIVSSVDYPKESVLLHELGHCWRVWNAKSAKNTVIAKRMPFPPLSPAVYEDMIYLNKEEVENNEQGINLKQYSNNEEYLNMFGLSEKGWNPMNESSYLAHRYGFVRLEHMRYWRYYPKKFQTVRENGVFDENLYEFYLSPEFKKRCPKFGIGDYECSDFDSRTGKNEKEYMSDQPKVVIKDISLSFDDSNFGDLLRISGMYSFPELKKLEISQPSGELWTSDHNKVLSVLLSKSPNLEKLYLYDIDLKELPKEIGNLTNLTDLTLSRCKNLTELPKEIGELTNLTDLSLFRCKNLTELPKEIGSLVNLEILRLSGIEAFDSIDDIPDEILSLPKLKSVSLNSKDGEHTQYSKEEISKAAKERKEKTLHAVDR